MAEHHALGEAGGAAGVENAEQGIAATARILHRFADRDQGFVVEHAARRFAVTGVDHLAHGFRLLEYLGAQFLVVIVDDQHRGFASRPASRRSPPALQRKFTGLTTASAHGTAR